MIAELVDARDGKPDHDRDDHAIGSEPVSADINVSRRDNGGEGFGGRIDARGQIPVLELSAEDEEANAAGHHRVNRLDGLVLRVLIEGITEEIS